MRPPTKRKPSRLNPLRSSGAFTAFVLDQLAEIGDVTSRAMFGGVGLYCRGLFFGIIAGDVLYLKVDESNRGDYERAGTGPFKPYRDRASTMQYYAVPVDVLESAFELETWARKAVAVAEVTSRLPPRARPRAAGRARPPSGRNGRRSRPR